MRLFEAMMEANQHVGKIVLQKSELNDATAKLNSLLEKKRGIFGRFSVSEEEIESLNKIILKSKQEIEKLENESSWKIQENYEKRKIFGKGQSLTRDLYRRIAQPQNYFAVDVASTPSSLIQAATEQKLPIPEDVAKVLSLESQLSSMR